MPKGNESKIIRSRVEKKNKLNGQADIVVYDT